MALPCQPDVVGYRWVLCCLHVPRVLTTISGKHRPVFFLFLFFLKIYLYIFLHFWSAGLVLSVASTVLFTSELSHQDFICPFYESMSLFITEHSEEIWLHHAFICSLSRRKAPANGQPVPQLPGGHDVSLAVPHCAA